MQAVVVMLVFLVLRGFDTRSARRLRRRSRSVLKMSLDQWSCERHPARVVLGCFGGSCDRTASATSFLVLELELVFVLVFVLVLGFELGFVLVLVFGLEFMTLRTSSASPPRCDTNQSGAGEGWGDGYSNLHLGLESPTASPHY